MIELDDPALSWHDLGNSMENKNIYEYLSWCVCLGCDYQLHIVKYLAWREDWRQALILAKEGHMTIANSHLKTAGNLIKGDLATVNAELKAGRETRMGVLWKVGCHLIVHAQQVVFVEGYTKKLAKSFKTDLCEETGLSLKQAGKYTETVSAALGVRGIRKGLRGIDGLPAAAADGVKAVEEFLVAAEITTWNKLIGATRVDKTPVQIVAASLAKLTPEQREKAMELAAKSDENENDPD